MSKFNTHAKEHGAVPTPMLLLPPAQAIHPAKPRVLLSPWCVLASFLSIRIQAALVPHRGLAVLPSHRAEEELGGAHPTDVSRAIYSWRPAGARVLGTGAYWLPNLRVFLSSSSGGHPGESETLRRFETAHRHNYKQNASANGSANKNKMETQIETELKCKRKQPGWVVGVACWSCGCYHGAGGKAQVQGFAGQ